MLKANAVKILQFAKSSIVDDISKLYSQHTDDIALIVEETRSDEARFGFHVELSLNDPTIAITRMRFVKQHSYLKRSIIKNPNQLDLLAKTEQGRDSSTA